MALITDLIQITSNRLEAWMQLVSPQIRKRAGIISVSTAVILTLLYTTIQKFNRPPKQLRHLPYVSYLSFLKYCFRDDLFETYSKQVCMPLLKESNGIYMRPIVEGWSIQLANPVAVKQVLFKPEASFPKAHRAVGAKGTLISKFIGGPNIVLLSGADWRRHRKIANPAFQRSMPVKAFGNLTIKMYKAMEDSGSDTIDVLNLFERWTLDAIGITGFDFDFNALGDKNSQWVRYYDSVKDGMSHPFYIFFPAFDTKYLYLQKKRKEVHDNLDKFLQNLDKIIEDKRKLVHENKDTTRDEDKDLLALMIESELNEEGAKLTNEELRSNLCIFFLAGHDTTANTLAFTLYELAINPELQEKAREEAIRVLGDAPQDIIPTIEQTKELTYINMIMKETMRRHSPVYNTTLRTALEDIEIAGHFIPKGSEFAVDIYNLHHNPDVWSDPYKFDPDRFLPGGEADQQEGVAWAPFSNGGRQCIGMNFSLAEQRVVLSMMCKFICIVGQLFTSLFFNDSKKV
ncbi:cytochrome P450 [Gilbertella persicaria]|uniref:cytochrome P450 n=1 Tax=Gilbertella persicaria TaxID=101096 RepID=UPI0022210F01|nr:cytochrome P450 [Gilbertella persicaria]KAI8085855.1 cytochrome P450 [Gilbertella persicaria]